MAISRFELSKYLSITTKHDNSHPMSPNPTRYKESFFQRSKRSLFTKLRVIKILHIDSRQQEGKKYHLNASSSSATATHASEASPSTVGRPFFWDMSTSEGAITSSKMNMMKKQINEAQVSGKRNLYATQTTTFMLISNHGIVQAIIRSAYPSN